MVKAACRLFPNTAFLPKYLTRLSVIFHHFSICFREGEEWARHRSSLNPKMLRPKEVEHYVPDFNLVIDDLLKKVVSLRNDRNEIEDIDKQFFKWSLESKCI